jgi:gliding motility-associated-like protein
MKDRLGIIILVLFLTTIGSTAQITSPQADAVKLVSYPIHPETDQLFAFYQSHGGYRPGALTADGPVAGTFDIVWTKYDPDADGFTIPVKAESNVQRSSIAGLDDGGYRAQVSNGVDVDTQFIAWVMLDDLKVWNLKDSEGNIPSTSSSCAEVNRLALSGFVEIDTFYYYDPVSHDRVLFQNDFDIEWSSDDPSLFIPNKNNKEAMALNTTFDPPILDTWFILTATDSLGMTERDSVFFDFPFTQAGFSVEYYDKIKMEWSSTLGTEWSIDNGSLDAPLTVRFINESLNGFKYTWVVLDTLGSFSEATREITFTMDEYPEFTYYNADKFYYPYLISESEDGPCPDTFRLEDGIRVVASQLLIPNVFTPNFDEVNDNFVFKHQSLKECRITISDRFGKVVYREKIDDIYQWEGWRGTILNSDRPAPEGQYYYVVEGLGYDNKEYRDPNILESIKAERQQGGSSGVNPDEPPAGQQNIYTGWLYLFR